MNARYEAMMREAGRIRDVRNCCDAEILEAMLAGERQAEENERLEAESRNMELVGAGITENMADGVISGEVVTACNDDLSDQERILREHRYSIGMARRLTVKMIAELDRSRDLHEAVVRRSADMLFGDDENKPAQELVIRTLSLNTRAQAMQKLVESLKNLVQLEREAYALNSSDSASHSIQNLSEGQIVERLSATMTQLKVVYGIGLK